MLDVPGVPPRADLTGEKDALYQRLRGLNADDMEPILEDSYATLPITDTEAANEFFQHVLDVHVAPRDK